MYHRNNVAVKYALVFRMKDGERQEDALVFEAVLNGAN